MVKWLVSILCSILMCVPTSLENLNENDNEAHDVAQSKTTNVISSAPSLSDDEMTIIMPESLDKGGDTDTVQPCIVGGYAPGGVNLPAPVPRIYGYLSWLDDSGYTHPLQFITVNIMDKTDGSLVATVQTNENGYYSFTCIETGQIYIQAFACGVGVEVYTLTGVYSFESPDYAYTGSTSLEISYTIGMGTTCGQAFQISQAIITAARYAQEMNGGTALPDVYVVYPHNNPEKDVSYYQYMGDELQTGMIYIHGVRSLPSGVPYNFFDDYENWDALMHEYGHHVSHFLDVYDGPGGSHTFGEDLIASRGEHDGTRLAWAEAYATIFGQMAQEYYAALLTNIVGVADAKYGLSDDAKIENLKDEYKKGEGSEMATASMLYDLYDAQDDGMDYISFGHQHFWDYIKNSKAVRFSQFVEYLYTEELVDVDSLGKNLGDHKFVSSNLQWTGGPKFTWDASSYTETTDPHVYPKYIITFKNAAGEVIHSRECIYNYCELPFLTFLPIKVQGVIYITLEEKYTSSADTPRYISQTFVINFNAS